MTRRTLRRGLAALLAAVVLSASVVACSDGGPRPVTTAEAERLASALYSNWDAGGATFQLSAAPSPGETTYIEGQVNFKELAGYGTVSAVGRDGALDAVLFTDTTMFESIPNLVAASQQFGGPTFTWVARPMDTETYDIDGLLGVVLGLATAQRDNPELIAQGDTKWLRTDTVNGIAVDVFEYSPQARFWLQQGTSTLVRFEGNNELLNRPIVVDFLDHEPFEVPMVDETQVVFIDDLGGLYEAYRFPVTT